uniref:Pectinesterase/pectinesterase inhibitor n=1 Tax=Ficus pumila var. awkeotsang TaxID=204231 RepID=PME1_FICPW|nr:RecName: Full=Pectinesterase/pectinesterase inhibitor; Includes: RecName: Full=Pectinesterase inhibitor; AltName: Full=Pectin methylesterase inhibitor; Includes: RecName: Full=Pectinesterase; Short=PE; AltName: Full=Pectin methylesterase; Flags: Precursor [Ficus pumila var. awkeotsang]
MEINQPNLLEASKSCYSKITFFLLVISFAALVSTGFSSPELSLHHKICDQSVNKESCLAMISEVTGLNMADHRNLLKSFLEKTTPRIQKAFETANDASRRINNPQERTALLDCAELMDLSKERVVDSISILFHQNLTTRSHEDLHVWLSGVLTNHVTCLDGLEEGSTDYIKTLMESHLNELILRARTSLAIFVTLFPAKSNVIEPVTGNFPTWVTAGDRRLLQTLGKDIEPDIVVAKDGSGDYETLNEAVAAIPDNSKKRVIVLVRTGIYEENVDFGYQKKNVMLVGEGMDYTIITGSRNVVDGSTTFDSATVAAVGDGFIAQDICFQNTAGPEKYQAVALRIGADETVINRCRIDAYQDTLYPHNYRQFYRDRNITGTVDFIFGNAAVVFQNCNLIPRKQMKGQENTITAQGRTDPNQNTGTSIQNCEIFASADLEPVEDTFKSYLGRPWKEYSRTVVMESYISDVIDPAGWLEWDRDFALKTLFYGEYRNGGPGSGTSERVKWPGYHVITSPEVAEQFTVAELIQGGSWLGSTGVDYTAGLYA